MPTTMTKAQRKKARDEFAALAAALPEPPTSLLATTVEPAPSRRALSAAQVLVGAVDPSSVERVAASLDALMTQVATLRAESAAPAGVAGRKRSDGRG